MFNCNIYLCDSEELCVDGVINFDNAAAVMQLGIKFINALQMINVNLTNLKNADSSALAVMAAWVRAAKNHNKAIKIHHMPNFLVDLSKVSNLDEVMPIVVNI